VNAIRQSAVLPWIIAVVGFPIGGFLGHLVAGPAATVPAAALSGLIAGIIVGLAQALALGLSPRVMTAWVAVTGIGLAAGLSILTAATGQIESTAEAVALGAVSGLAIGAAQAAILIRERIGNAWLWIPATGLAWAVGWLVTSSIGVALEAGWPVFGLSGAIVSQIITAVVVWRVVRERVAVAA
jgi:hypothetical protein